MSATARLVGGIALVAAAFLVLMFVVFDDDRYEAVLTVPDAGGLIQGSEIKRGGVSIGSVDLDLRDDDRVRITLNIEPKYAPLTEDSQVAIVSANLLGQKFLEVRGDQEGEPVPDGGPLPVDRVLQSTDLDQVLNVLDADTRGRLAIFLNEAGVTFDGRRQDLATVLDQLPTAFADATTVVDQIVGDNQHLASLVERSDSFVAEMTERKRELTFLLDRLGGSMETIAARRAELRETLAQAPGTLVELRRFLGELEATTIPLGPAAREITASAPALADVLDRVEPLRAAAEPTLKQAEATAPRLTALADGATPVIQRALPTARVLTQFTQKAVPATDALDSSVDNLLATVDNWTRAIQFRDGLGHVFRGEASVSPDLFLSMIDRLSGGTRKRGGRRQNTPARKPPQTGVAPAAPAPATSRPAAPKPVQNLLDSVTKPLHLDKTLDDTVDLVQGLVGDLQNGTRPLGDQTNDLLDYLLGN